MPSKADAGDDQSYELWLLGPHAAGRPWPLGVFQPGDDGSIRVAVAGLGDRLAAAQALAITVEPRAGSARPTSPPLLYGEL
jgi:anti-sigma-K factor RskA